MREHYNHLAEQIVVKLESVYSRLGKYEFTLARCRRFCAAISPSVIPAWVWPMSLTLKSFSG